MFAIKTVYTLLSTFLSYELQSVVFSDSVVSLFSARLRILRITFMFIIKYPELEYFLYIHLIWFKTLLILTYLLE